MEREETLGGLKVDLLARYPDSPAHPLFRIAHEYYENETELRALYDEVIRFTPVLLGMVASLRDYGQQVEAARREQPSAI
ncbi:MAG TPA: hypothetical protein VNN09_15315 [Candidatus Competibacteraceae bacterium]|nr:hypothetical protein [Candidatus Competibacteraceae bacterium]